MIEQQNNLLLISFPSPEAATQAKRWMEVAVLPWLPMVSQPAPDSSVPPSVQPQEQQLPTPAFPEQNRSRHVLLTDERLEQLSHQRTSGQTSHQRLLRAQTTLRDGTLPFSKPGQAPQPSGQASPRQRAQAEGGFADGALAVRPRVAPQLAPQLGRPKADGEAGQRKKSQLRPVPSSQPPSRS